MGAEHTTNKLPPPQCAKKLQILSQQLSCQLMVTIT